MTVKTGLIRIVNLTVGGVTVITGLVTTFLWLRVLVRFGNPAALADALAVSLILAVLLGVTVAVEQFVPQ